MGAIIYDHIFVVGEDQHFSGLADGKTGTPPKMACANGSPLFGIYYLSIHHVASITEWTVLSSGTHKYAGWGEDYAAPKYWSTGAIGLIELVDRQSVQISLYDPDGVIIDNDVTDESDEVEVGGVAATEITAVTGGWTFGEHVGKVLLWTSGALDGKQYSISVNGVGTVTCNQPSGRGVGDFVNDGVLAGDTFEIHSRPYTGETQMHYLGNLTMTLTDETYGNIFRYFSDSVGVTDQVTITQTLIRLLSESAGVTDAHTWARVLGRYVSDSAGVTDQVEGLIAIVKRLSESMGITDDLIGGLVIGRLLSDSLGITDAKTRHGDLVRMLSEAQGVTDAVATTASYIRTLADSLPITDIDHPAVTFDRTFGDSLGLTDALVDALYLVIIKRISEAVGISDARLALRAMAYAFSDGIDITDAREKFVTIVRLFSGLAGLSDGLATAQDHGRKVSDDAGVTDAAKGLLTIIRLLSDTEGLSDAAIGEITAAIIERALSESVGISDDAVETLFALFWKLISDNEGIEDNAEAMQALVRRISELSVGITDVAAKSQTLIRALSDTQAVADAVAFTFTIIQKISDQVGISDRILGQILAYAMYKLYLAGSTEYMEVTPAAAELVALSLGTRDYMQFELETFDSEVAR